MILVCVFSWLSVPGCCMFGFWCLSFVVFCLLYVVCWFARADVFLLLVMARCWLCVVCLHLCVVCWSLCGVCCLLVGCVFCYDLSVVV